MIELAIAHLDRAREALDAAKRELVKATWYEDEIDALMEIHADLQQWVVRAEDDIAEDS